VLKITITDNANTFGISIN